MEEILQIPEITNNILRYLKYDSVTNLLRTNIKIRKFVFLGLKWRESILKDIFYEELGMRYRINHKFERLFIWHIIHTCSDYLHLLVNIIYHIDFPFIMPNSREIFDYPTLYWIESTVNNINVALKNIRKILNSSEAFIKLECRTCPFIEYYSDSKFVHIKYENNKWFCSDNDKLYTVIVYSIESFLFVHLLVNNIRLNSDEIIISPFNHLLLAQMHRFRHGHRPKDNITKYLENKYKE